MSWSHFICVTVIFVSFFIHTSESRRSKHILKGQFVGRSDSYPSQSNLGHLGHGKDMKVLNQLQKLDKLSLPSSVAAVREVAAASSIKRRLDDATTTLPSSCSDNIYVNGFIDLDAMVYNCSSQIPSPLQPPSYLPIYDDGNYRPVNVSVQILLHSILSVDDLLNQFSLHFSLHLVWYDERWVMPDMWSELNPATSENGIELSSYINNQNPLNIWLPEMNIGESVQLNILDQLIKLLPDGVLYWSQSIVGVFSRDRTTLHHYPLDEQKFVLHIGSAQFVEDFVTVEFPIEGGVIFSNYADNSIWSYESYSAEIINVTIASTSQYSTRIYSYARITLQFARDSRGVVYRLALPVLIFLVVVGASWWVDTDKRIDITTQIMLVVAALYLFIGQTIPQVGYLTRMDLYMITVFVLLASIAILNYFIDVLLRKNAKYPVFELFEVISLWICRSLWIPAILTMFVIYFFEVDEHLAILPAVVSAMFLVYAIAKWPSILLYLRLAILKTRIKEQAVEAHAKDEETGLPLRMLPIEKITLSFTSGWYKDTSYAELLDALEIRSIRSVDNNDQPRSAERKEDLPMPLQDIEQSLDQPDAPELDRAHCSSPRNKLTHTLDKNEPLATENNNSHNSPGIDRDEVMNTFRKIALSQMKIILEDDEVL